MIFQRPFYGSTRPSLLEKPYDHGGLTVLTANGFAASFLQTARMGGMHGLPRFLIQGALPMIPDLLEVSPRDYPQLLVGLSDGKMNRHNACVLTKLNEMRENFGS